MSLLVSFPGRGGLSNMRTAPKKIALVGRVGGGGKFFPL